MTLSPQCAAYAHNRLSGVRHCLSEDIKRYLTKSPFNMAGGDNLKKRTSAFITPELMAIALYRISHYLYTKQLRRSAVVCSRLNTLLHKITITPQSCIGPGCRLPHPGAVTFHGTAGIGLTMYSRAICCPSSDNVGGAVECGPVLGHHVVLGGHAVVMGPVTIGDNAKIGYTVCVSQDIPPGLVYISSVNRERIVMASAKVPALQ